MTDAERQYWTELRRVCLADAAAIERYLKAQIDAARLHIEMHRSESLWRRATAEYEKGDSSK